MGKLLFYLSWIAGVLWSFTLVVAIWENDLKMFLLACSFLAHAALVGALSQNPKKKSVKVYLFVQTRKMLRDQLRRKFGNRGLRRAWQEYQAEHRGKPKLLTFAVANGKKG